MKKIIKYVAILGMLFCMCGFMTSVYADNEQGINISSEIETKLSEIDSRLSSVEELKENKIVEKLIENEDLINNKFNTWFSAASGLIALISTLIAIIGVIVPYFSQKRNNKEFNSMKNEWLKEKKDLIQQQLENQSDLRNLRVEIEDLKSFSERTIKKMKAYTYFAMASNENDDKKKIELYTTAIELYPDYSKAYIQRAYSYCEINKYILAKKDAMFALHKEPYNTEIYNIIAHAEYGLKRYDEALEWLNKALEINHEDSRSIHNKGVVYSRMGLLDKALKAANRAIELAPENEVTYYSRALIYKKMRKKDEYESDMNTYKQLQEKRKNLGFVEDPQDIKTEE